MHAICIIDSSTCYHNLKHDKKLSYLTISACQFCRCRFTRLLFGMAQADDMFQQKINKIFKDLQYKFGIADDILIVGYDTDGRDHERTMREVMQTCH